MTSVNAPVSGPGFVRMSMDDMKEIRRKMHKEWMKVIFTSPIKEILMKCIDQTCCVPSEEICPSYTNIFNAFNHFAPKDTKVVIMGQDPYPRPDYAHGYSFSVASGVMAESLKNINKCLKQTCGVQLDNACFGTDWAKQGVLLLNRYLTTIINKSNAPGHQVWKEFTDAIIAILARDATNAIYILWGAKAKELQHPLLAMGIDPRRILTWSHPSPLADNSITIVSQKFMNCPHFNDVNELLLADGQPEIVWGIPITTVDNITMMPVIPNMHVLFTDGAASNNGKDNCTAGWGYHFTHGEFAMTGACGVIGTSDDGTPPSNNRGELLAMILALEKIAAGTSNAIAPDTPLVIIADSTYALNIVDKWLDSWIQQGKVDSMKNPDYLRRLVPVLADLKERGYKIICKKVESHLPAPPKSNIEEYFLWQGNNVADKLATDGAKLRPGESTVVLHKDNGAMQSCLPGR